MPDIEAPKSSLCVFKQYVGDVKKPLHLHGAETMQVTLSGSLSFVVALAWNDFFRTEFEKLVSVRDDRRKVVYAMLATIVLFVFNMGIGAAVSMMRNRAQFHASSLIKKTKSETQNSHSEKLRATSN